MCYFILDQTNNDNYKMQCKISGSAHEKRTFNGQKIEEEDAETKQTTTKKR